MIGEQRMMRMGSVGRAELTLLWRNRTALFNALAIPAFTFPVVATNPEVPVPVLAGLWSFVLIAAVYYNLVTTYVARREALVLKRFRTGELTDAEILAAVAVPSTAIALGQILLYSVIAAFLLDLPVPKNVPVLILAVAAGSVVCVLLAAASASFTRTVELAQVTTLPVVLLCLAGSGVVIPLAELPDPVATVLRALPLRPVLDLIELGWLGGGGAAEYAVPLGILAAWTVAGVLIVRRWFSWEPRR